MQGVSRRALFRAQRGAIPFLRLLLNIPQSLLKIDHRQPNAACLEALDILVSAGFPNLSRL